MSIPAVRNDRAIGVGRDVGPYRIDALLGAGGMGIVYRAHDRARQRTVAIKVVDRRSAGGASPRWLVREARVAGALRHPSICVIHEIGYADGEPFIVMEHVAGKTLASLIPPHQGLALDAALLVGDTGEPNPGAFCRSPDVIVRQAQVANPQASFGAGSGTENDDTLSEPAIAGQDNYVYVRLMNRGGRDAANVQVDVFVAPPASLILASDWQHVGTTVVANLPAGNVLTVADPIVLAAGALPTTGHYCFVAIAGNAADPAPPAADFDAWDRYERFIGANNNVVWRNFNLVSPDAPTGSSGDAVVVDFDMVGAPDRARPMTLQVVAQLPMGAVIALETSMNVIEAWGMRPPVVRPADEDRGVLDLNAHGVFTTPDLALRAGTHVPIRLRVYIPDHFRQNAYEIHARQLHEGREVGRITWRLQRPSRRSLMSNVVRRIMSMWRS